MVHNNCMSPNFPQTPCLPSDYVCVEVYTVGTGDTLYSISQKYGISVEMLMEANRILNPYNLRYGQKICIPGHTSECPIAPENAPAECPNDVPPMPAPAPAPAPTMPQPAPTPTPAPAPMPTPGPMPMPMPMPTPAPAPMPTPAPMCNGIYHRIQAGDTFYMLSKKYHVSVDAILNANPDLNPYQLRIGTKICIPIHETMPNSGPPKCNGSIYTIKSGDTLYMLAKRHGLTLDGIMNANPQIDCYRLDVGMKICIPEASASRVTEPTQPSMPARPYMPTTPQTPTQPSMPARPSMPTTPQTPTQPSMPARPSMPTTPQTPTQPSMPARPSMPTTPQTPTQPSMPARPSMPTTPQTPTQPSMPARPSMPTTPQAPTQPKEEVPACDGFHYTIQSGDTLYMLAKRYQMSLDQLMQANPDLDPYNLRIGMIICIPYGNNAVQTENDQYGKTDQQSNRYAEECKGERRYQTQKGDTLIRILSRYDISYAALENSNPDVDFKKPLENLTLCIPADDSFRTCPMSEAYIVKTGDSLDTISKKLLVVPERLLTSNPTLTVEDFSIAGNKVCIPI